MTDSQWSKDAPPPKKKGLPGWLWFCGAGCLLLVIVAAIAGYFGWDMIKKGRDPDIQWPKLQKVLPFEERPSNLDLLMGLGGGGLGTFSLVDQEAGLTGTVFSLGDGGGEALVQMMDPDYTGGFLGVGARSEMEEEVMMVRGIELETLHHYISTPGQDEKTGQSLMVDLGPVAVRDNVMLQLLRLQGREKITPEEVEAFLSGFDF